MEIEELVKECMTLKEYPTQSPSWRGWEIISEADNVKHLREVCNIDWWEGVEFICLQCEEDFSRFVLCVDCNVWELSLNEFKGILEKIKSCNLQP